MLDSLTAPYMIWLYVGLAFAGLELAAPGLILIFFGLGAWVTALFVFIHPFGPAWQLGLFSASSVVSLLVLRRYAKAVFRGKTQPGDGEVLADEDVGKRAVVTRETGPETPGQIKHRGSFWAAVSKEAIPAGSNVKITGRLKEDKNVFTVE